MLTKQIIEVKKKQKQKEPNNNKNEEEKNRRRSEIEDAKYDSEEETEIKEIPEKDAMVYDEAELDNNVCNKRKKKGDMGGPELMWNPHNKAPCRNFFCKHFENSETSKKNQERAFPAIFEQAPKKVILFKFSNQAKIL